MPEIYRRLPCFAVLLVAALGAVRAQEPAGLEIAVSFGEAQSAEPVDGRVLVLLAATDDPEPRFQVSGRLDSAQVFGVDVEGLAPGEPAVIDAAVFGYPVTSLAGIKAGEYTVQAVLHRYETFRPAHGHTLKLPMDRGEGQQWSRAPGNLYSSPQRLRVDPAETKRLELRFDQVIAPIDEPEDTRYIKHVKIESELLTEFWGRPMHLGAHGFGCPVTAVPRPAPTLR